MPELPEIETIRRSVADLIAGAKITAVEVFQTRQVATHDPAAFAAAVSGRRLVRFERRGKYLILGLDDGQRLVIHLRMTGQLLVCRPEAPVARHTHVVFHLEDGRQLRYRDVRRFGRIYLLGPEPFSQQARAPGCLRRLGPEPLDPEFTSAAFCERLRGRRGALKPLLLRQDFIAGLGNIYADEALHRARLHPLRPAHSLTPAECEALFGAIREVLTEAIVWGGTTIADFRDGYGRSGAFRQRLRVYGRQGEPCLTCGQTVVKIRVAGRSSHFCPRCQPLPGQRRPGQLRRREGN